jgi:hypothetical protein
MNSSNYTRTLTIATLLAGSTLFGITGCNKSDRNDMSAKTKEIVADTKDALNDGWDNVRNFTYEKRNDFSTSAKAMSASMEAKMSELRANYSEATASASRRSAMEELRNSEADYKQKLDALGTATADTWDSAKQNVIASWDKLQASYHKARAN